jgi:hypothetical protein
MKKSRYYFCAESAEFCRPLARIREWMKREGNPRNGKNGRCRFSKNGYEPDLQNPIIITI